MMPKCISITVTTYMYMHQKHSSAWMHSFYMWHKQSNYLESCEQFSQRENSILRTTLTFLRSALQSRNYISFYVQNSWLPETRSLLPKLWEDIKGKWTWKENYIFIAAFMIFVESACWEKVIIIVFVPYLPPLTLLILFPPVFVCLCFLMYWTVYTNNCSWV